MAAKYRYQIFMNGPYAGASETYYLDIAEQPIWDLLKSLQPIIDARAKMLGRGWVTHSHRLTQVEDELGVKTSRVSFAAYREQSPVSTATNQCLPVNTAVKAQIFSDSQTSWKFVSFAGARKVVASNDSQYTSDAGWTTDLTAFMQKLAQADLGWFKRDEQASATITGYTVSADNVVTVTLGGLLAPAPTTPKFNVRISGVEVVGPKARINGEWVATAYTPGSTTSTFQLVPRMALFPYLRLGSVRTFTEEWVAAGLVGVGEAQALDYRVWGLGKRQRGRPFGISPGRVEAKPLG